ncbi:MAG: M48 family metalloprotease [bacterium]|nr:M48 family metalloprotease [bacterium]
MTHRENRQNIHTPRIHPVLLAVLGAILLLACERPSGLPAAIPLPLFTISDAEEGRIGEQAELEVLATTTELEAPDLAAYVDQVGQALGTGTERRAVRWRFHLIDEPAPNAFALPGGAIFVTRGALLAMRDGSELAGVLGHEVAHVGLRHGAHALQRQIVLEGLTRAAIDDRSAVVGRLAGVAGELARKGFSREDERAADREALRLANLIGFAPDGLERFLDTLRVRLGDTHPALEALSDHPLLSERIGQLSALRREVGLSATRRDEMSFRRLIDAIE